MRELPDREDEPVGLLAKHFDDALKIIKNEIELHETKGEVVGLLIWIMYFPNISIVKLNLSPKFPSSLLFFAVNKTGLHSFVSKNYMKAINYATDLCKLSWKIEYFSNVFD
mgnify:CR=1 FL=1